MKSHTSACSHRPDVIMMYGDGERICMVCYEKGKKYAKDFYEMHGTFSLDEVLRRDILTGMGIRVPKGSPKVKFFDSDFPDKEGGDS